MPRTSARTRKPKGRKAKGSPRKKARKAKARDEEVVLDDEKYSYQGSFKPERDESP